MEIEEIKSFSSRIVQNTTRNSMKCFERLALRFKKTKQSIYILKILRFEWIGSCKLSRQKKRNAIHHYKLTQDM